jgi:putative ABC transport system substrate-binding protein
VTAFIGRREFITLLSGAAAWPLAAGAQMSRNVPIIGFLGSLSRSAQSTWTAAFEQRMQEHGWIEDRSMVIEYRWAEGRAEQFSEFAAEFVRLKVDVIVTGDGRSHRRKEDNVGHSHRIRNGRRPGCQRPGGKFGSTGRQRHRPLKPVGGPCR